MSGWSNQIVGLIIIDAQTGFSGLFVYNGPPGPGNLLLSIASANGTDPYGNVYTQGLALYQGASAIFNDNAGNQLQISNAVINILPVGATIAAQIRAFASELDLSSPATAALPVEATVTLLPGATNSVVVTSPLAAIQPSTTFSTPEIWHNVAPPAGWTGTLRYKLLAETNRVALDYALTHAALAAQTNVQLLTLPATPFRYRPATATTLPCTPTNNTANGTPAPATFIGTGGITTAFNIPVGTTGIDCHETFPLD